MGRGIEEYVLFWHRVNKQFSRLIISVERNEELAVIPFKKSVRVSLCEATHCRRARALQTLFEAAAVN